MNGVDSDNFASIIARSRFCPDCNRLMEPLKTTPDAWKCHYCRARWTTVEPKDLGDSSQAMHTQAENRGDVVDT